MRLGILCWLILASCWLIMAASDLRQVAEFGAEYPLESELELKQLTWQVSPLFNLLRQVDPRLGRQNNDDIRDLLDILSLVALALILVYIVVVVTTTTTKSGRRNFADQFVDDEIETLDAPTWLTFVHQLLVLDAANELPCAQRTLCRMNRAAAGQRATSGWAVSMTSVPLSYLLHRNQERGGFFRYLMASASGWSGANCSALYAQCSSLN